MPPPHFVTASPCQTTCTLHIITVMCMRRFSFIKEAAVKQALQSNLEVAFDAFEHKVVELLVPLRQ